MKNNKLIDLRSDTVTLANEEMRAAIYTAKIGDHNYDEDETTLELEAYCADLFGVEAALFMVSGTMSNQIALRCFTKPGEEVILDSSYHIHYFEAGPTVDLAKVHLNLCSTKDGVLRVEDISQAFNNKHRSAYYSIPTLVCLENTINAYGGRIFPLAELMDVYHFCKQKKLNVHLDGARLLNACAATGISPSKYAKLSDSLTICFSKGLGAPFGSILMGSRSFIDEAAKYKKWYGGGMHQSGFMAAAALYAIKHNTSRLADDNHNAKRLAYLLSESILPTLKADDVQTNIVIFDVTALNVSAKEFVALARNYNILLYPWGESHVRAVTHLNITENDIEDVVLRLQQLASGLKLKRIG
jgi:threonine aldolase